MIEERAQAQPSAPAVCAWDGELTYGELDQLATRLAGRLVDLGVGPDVLVPLCFEKSMWTTVAMLGVLKAGGAFVMLDSAIPEQRLQTLFHQIGSNLMLSSIANMALSLRLSKTVIRVGPDSTKISSLVVSPGRKSQPSSTAMYAVFTSGSTGTPKGVVLSHQNFCSALNYQLQLLGFTKDSRVLDFASYTFDVAVHNAFATFVAGGCLCIPADRDRKDNVDKVITSMRATIANLTPTVSRLLDPMTVPDLKTMISLGETVTIKDAERWWGKSYLVNTYGPAECTPISTINYSASSPEEATRIGKGAGAGDLDSRSREPRSSAPTWMHRRATTRRAACRPWLPKRSGEDCSGIY